MGATSGGDGRPRAAVAMRAAGSATVTTVTPDRGAEVGEQPRAMTSTTGVESFARRMRSQSLPRRLTLRAPRRLPRPSPGSAHFGVAGRGLSAHDPRSRPGEHGYPNSLNTGDRRGEHAAAAARAGSLAGGQPGGQLHARAGGRPANHRERDGATRRGRQHGAGQARGDSRSSRLPPRGHSGTPSRSISWMINRSRRLSLAACSLLSANGTTSTSNSLRRDGPALLPRLNGRERRYRSQGTRGESRADQPPRLSDHRYLGRRPRSPHGVRSPGNPPGALTARLTDGTPRPRPRSSLTACTSRTGIRCTLCLGRGRRRRCSTSS